MRAVAFAVSCLLVLGFYGYVFAQLYREHKRFKGLEKRLREHLYAMTPELEAKSGPSKVVQLPKVPEHIRKETLIHVGLAIGGLAGLFAEIGFLSQLVDSLH
jgi:hypothetical protein